MPRYTPLAQASWCQPDAVTDCPFRASLPEHQFALRGLFSGASAPLREQVVQQHNPSLLIGLCRKDVDVISILVAASKLTPLKENFLFTTAE